MASTRRRNIAFSVNADGNAEFEIYTKPDTDGKQGIAETIVFNPDDIHDGLVNTLALYGVAALVRQSVNQLDDPQASELRATFDKVAAGIKSGEWTPGRTFAAAEPSDLELAVAEVTGQPVDAVQRRFADDKQKNEDGTPKLDKRGRELRVWTERAQRDLANDPRVKPVLARIVAERAKRMAAEAKGAKPTVGGALDMFAPAAPVAEAAQ